MTRAWAWVLAGCGGGDQAAVAPAAPTSWALPAPVEVSGPSAVQIGGVPAASLPDVAERVNRSVVAITVEKPMSAAVGLPPGFFEVPQHQGRTLDGVGAGVVARTDGVILTNHHVIDGAERVEVALADGRRLEARVVGGDPTTDVAVIRLAEPPPDLVPIDFGTSGDLRVGEVVLAVGNPFGVGQTVTMGIVSALGRTGLGLTEYEDFIQTDAAINPGNSGGALVDLHGRLVGLVAAIRSESGGSDGIAFAIPVDRLRRTAEALLEKGRVERGFLGVSLEPVDAGPGVRITSVLPDSPAAAAGVLPGDVVVALDGQPVRDVPRFRYEVASLGAGHPFTATVLRGGEPVEVAGTLGPVPGDGAVAAVTRVGGAEVARLDGDARARFALPPSLSSGVVVLAVADGPLAEAGLAAGDVILDVDRDRVDDPAGLAARWDGARGGRLLLRVWRGGDVRMVAAEVR